MAGIGRIPGMGKGKRDHVVSISVDGFGAAVIVRA